MYTCRRSHRTTAPTTPLEGASMGAAAYYCFSRPSGAIAAGAAGFVLGLGLAPTATARFGCLVRSCQLTTVVRPGGFTTLQQAERRCCQ